MDSKQFRRIQTRRGFFEQCAGGIGIAALAQLMQQEGRAADVNPLAPRKPHFAAKAKNVIFMFMEGGPSQIDLFDPKPGLQEWSGKPLPPEMTKDLRLAFTKPNAAVLASPRTFQPYGQSGIEFSDYIPHIGSCADDLCLVRSMYTDAFNHHPGQLLLFGGSIQVGRPTMGAWVLYGLGSESQNLPGFVVLGSGVGTSAGTANWSSGFLPSTYQGVVNSDEDWYTLHATMRGLGQYASPDDCWLTLRGMRTLGVRLAQQMDSGIEVAHWLSRRPEVKQVLHPALPGAPGHAIWKRDFSGACSLFGVEFKPAHSVESTHAFVEALDLFGIGASWGGFESLALPTTGFLTRTAGGAKFDGPLVRLHIGLEDVTDLIADLEAGLKVMREFGR